MVFKDVLCFIVLTALNSGVLCQRSTSFLMKHLTLIFGDVASYNLIIEASNLGYSNIIKLECGQIKQISQGICKLSKDTLGMPLVVIDTNDLNSTTADFFQTCKMTCSGLHDSNATRLYVLDLNLLVTTWWRAGMDRVKIGQVETRSLYMASYSNYEISLPDLQVSGNLPELALSNASSTGYVFNYSLLPSEDFKFHRILTLVDTNHTQAMVLGNTLLVLYQYFDKFEKVLINAIRSYWLNETEYFIGKNKQVFWSLKKYKGIFLPPTEKRNYTMLKVPGDYSKFLIYSRETINGIGETVFFVSDVTTMRIGQIYTFKRAFSDCQLINMVKAKELYNVLICRDQNTGHLYGMEFIYPPFEPFALFQNQDPDFFFMSKNWLYSRMPCKGRNSSAADLIFSYEIDCSLEDDYEIASFSTYFYDSNLRVALALVDITTGIKFVFIAYFERHAGPVSFEVRLASITSLDFSQIIGLENTLMAYVKEEGFVSLKSGQGHKEILTPDQTANTGYTTKQCCVRHLKACAVFTKKESSEVGKWQFTVHRESDRSSNRIVFGPVIVSYSDILVDCSEASNNEMTVMVANAVCLESDPIADVMVYRFHLAGTRLLMNIARTADFDSYSNRSEPVPDHPFIELIGFVENKRRLRINIETDRFLGFERVEMNSSKRSQDCLVDFPVAGFEEKQNSYDIECLIPVVGHIFGINLSPTSDPKWSLTRPTRHYNEYRWVHQDCLRVERFSSGLYVCQYPEVDFTVYRGEEKLVKFSILHYFDYQYLFEHRWLENLMSFIELPDGWIGVVMVFYEINGDIGLNVVGFSPSLNKLKLLLSENIEHGDAGVTLEVLQSQIKLVYQCFLDCHEIIILLRLNHIASKVRLSLRKNTATEELERTYFKYELIAGNFDVVDEANWEDFKLRSVDMIMKGRYVAIILNYHFTYFCMLEKFALCQVSQPKCQLNSIFLENQHSLQVFDSWINNIVFSRGRPVSTIHQSARCSQGDLELEIVIFKSAVGISFATLCFEHHQDPAQTYTFTQMKVESDYSSVIRMPKIIENVRCLLSINNYLFLTSLNHSDPYYASLYIFKRPYPYLYQHLQIPYATVFDLNAFHDRDKPFFYYYDSRTHYLFEFLLSSYIIHIPASTTTTLVTLHYQPSNEINLQINSSLVFRSILNEGVIFTKKLTFAEKMMWGAIIVLGLLCCIISLICWLCLFLKVRREAKEKNY